MDFFHLKLFPESLFELIVFESTRYAIKKNKNKKKQPNFKLTVHELKTYLGINIIMTYINYPKSRKYCLSILGVRMDLIANSTPLTRFEEIK